MDSRTAPPRVYLLAIDGNASAEHVVDEACHLGAAIDGPAELHLLHVVGMLATGGTKMDPEVVSPTDMLEAGRLLLDRMKVHAAKRFEGKIVTHLGDGDPSREILEMGSHLRADLILVGTAGRTGFTRMALGSVAEKVVRRALCPVLVVRPKDYREGEDQVIQPPCRDGIATQERTGRAELWCGKHGAQHGYGRLHYELPPAQGRGT